MLVHMILNKWLGRHCTVIVSAKQHPIVCTSQESTFGEVWLKQLTFCLTVKSQIKLILIRWSPTNEYGNQATADELNELKLGTDDDPCSIFVTDCFLPQKRNSTSSCSKCVCKGLKRDARARHSSCSSLSCSQGWDLFN